MNYQLPSLLRSLRERSGLSQSELAETARRHGGGISQAMVSLWEKGEREPRSRSLFQLLEALDASFFDIQIFRRIYERYPPDQPLEPLTDAELAALPQLDRRMRLFVQEKPGSLRARILYHAIKGQVLMEAIGDESEKLTAYIEERFRAAEEAP